MRNWKARLLVGFMLVAMMLATVAGPALANDGKQGNGFNGRGNNNNNNNNRFEDCGWHHCGFERDILFDGFDENLLISGFNFGVPVVYVVEIDVDCDGINDRWDWWIGNDCEIEDVDIELLFD